MGLFDGALGALLGGATGGTTGAIGAIAGNFLGGATPPQQAGAPAPGAAPDPLLAVALGVMQQQGGLAGIVGALSQGGLGPQAASWVGTGPNQPVTGAQISSALGPGAIASAAGSLGVPEAQAGDALATVLPQLIDHMTPRGQVPGNHADILSAAMTMLGSAQQRR